MDIVFFLKEISGILDGISELICNNKKDAAFQLLNQEMGKIQEYILFLANNEVIALEIVNEISTLLVRAMTEKDSVLLLDVCKYALLNVAEQLLEGCDENECEV